MSDIEQLYEDLKKRLEFLENEPLTLENKVRIHELSLNIITVQDFILKNLKSTLNNLKTTANNVVTPVNDKPYIETVTRNFEYNPNYGDNRICKCGHAYYRHFDSYEDNANVGCKYCQCHDFEEAK